VSLVMLLGAGVGVGVLVILNVVFPAPPSLAAELARMHRPYRPRTLGAFAPAEPARAPGPGWVMRLGEFLGVERLVSSGQAASLRVAGITMADHIAQRVVFGLAAAGVGVVLSLALATLGAGVFLLWPTVGLAARATARRRAFRHALSAFLDVVAITLAAGRAVETALRTASRAGQGWAFAELETALFEADRGGEAPWDALDRLGAELGVPELRELAASVALAGEEGAVVGASVAAKATALRTRALTEAEAAAESASERMALPTVMLLVGFVIFIGYPAVAAVVSGF
jgi:tight adherence protein C